MSNLNDVLENAQTPTGGTIDLTSLSSHGQYIAGFVAFFGLAGLAATAYNHIKSKTGVDAVQSAMPEV